MEQRSKTVLMIIPKGNANAQAASGTVRECIVARNWEFFSVETFRSGEGRIMLARSSRSAESLPALVRLLHPDGVMVWTDPVSRAEARAAAGHGVPIVFIEISPIPGERHPGPDGFVYADPESIAALAARTLLSSGYGDFAYVPNSYDAQWCRERHDAFARSIALVGRRFHAFERTKDPPGSPAATAALGKWLDAIPKPCGIFAANDAAGEELLAACRERGIRVPEDVAVVAVDNLPYICESTSPTLSSIAVDLASEGRAAAAMMAEMIEKRSRARRHTVPALAIVNRASSGFARDRRIAKAVEFIRVGALREGFGPRDVVRAMGVSRALADRLFRTVLGHTILEEIHSVRLARAKALLSAGTQPDIAAAECGYASHDDFRRVFRRRVGTTAWEWARKNRS